jgi:hypothetical protein
LHRLVALRATQDDEDFDIEAALALGAEMRERIGDVSLSQEIDSLYDERGLPK